MQGLWDRTLRIQFLVYNKFFIPKVAPRSSQCDLWFGCLCVQIFSQCICHITSEMVRFTLVIHSGGAGLIYRDAGSENLLRSMNNPPDHRYSSELWNWTVSKCIIIIVVDNYWPQWSCGQGNVFTGVCYSVHRWGCLPQCMLGYHTPQEQTPPPPRGRHHPRNRHPQSRHPPQEADTPTHPRSRHPPEADTPWVQTPPRSRHPPKKQTSPRADTPQSRPPRADPPRADTPQEAGSSIWSISSRYASYWKAFLFEMHFVHSLQNSLSVRNGNDVEILCQQTQ